CGGVPMSFIRHRRGYLFEYAEPFEESMLVQEVTLDEYLAIQYPPFLMERFPEQAQADRDRERKEIQAAILPRDTPWLWRRVGEMNVADGVRFECGGLAVKRAGTVIRVWLVWDGC